MVFIEITETSLMQITKGFEVTSATQTNLMALKVPPPFNVPLPNKGLETKNLRLQKVRSTTCFKDKRKKGLREVEH